MIYPDWLYDQHTSQYIWMTNHHTRQSIPADWPTNTPAYKSVLTDQPTYQPIPAGWLTAQHTWLYLLELIDQRSCLNIYPSWLTDTSLSVRVDWPTNITYQSIRVDWLTNMLDFLSGMTDRPTYLTIRVDWPTNIPAFLSGLTDWQTYLTIIYPYWNLCVVCCQLLTSACLLPTFI